MMGHKNIYFNFVCMRATMTCNNREGENKQLRNK